jgi:hypothetical protein
VVKSIVASSFTTVQHRWAPGSIPGERINFWFLKQLRNSNFHFLLNSTHREARFFYENNTSSAIQSGVCGLVVKSIVAKRCSFIFNFDGPRVRFPANAFIFGYFWFLILAFSYTHFGNFYLQFIIVVRPLEQIFFGLLGVKKSDPRFAGEQLCR